MSGADLDFVMEGRRESDVRSPNLLLRASETTDQAVSTCRTVSGFRTPRERALTHRPRFCCASARRRESGLFTRLRSASVQIGSDRSSGVGVGTRRNGAGDGAGDGVGQGEKDGIEDVGLGGRGGMCDREGNRGDMGGGNSRGLRGLTGARIVA